MATRVRLRSESLPAVIPEITLTTSDSPFREGRRDSDAFGRPQHQAQQTLCRSEGHLPSIRITDRVVKRHVIGEGKKDKKIYLDVRPLFNSLTRSEENLPSINDTGSLIRRHSTPRDVLFVSKATRSNGLPGRHYGKKRRRAARVEMTPHDPSKSEGDHEEGLSSIAQEPFLLPPLPTGSMTFQTVLREFNDSDTNSSSDDSGSEASDLHKFPVGRKKRKGSRPKLAWYGPIVEYKGHHIYLSTLNYLKSNAGRFIYRPWC